MYPIAANSEGPQMYNVNEAGDFVDSSPFHQGIDEYKGGYIASPSEIPFGMPIAKPETPDEAGIQYYPTSVSTVLSPTGEDPITALAYDTNVYALHVALPSQILSRRAYKGHKASMLLTQSLSGDMLYSTVAGHPEAHPSVLNAIYEVIYGMNVLPNPSSSAGSCLTTQPARPSHYVPAHSYRPQYGNVDPASSAQANCKSFQKGISALMAFGGYCASVSPSGVRLHRLGGFLEAIYNVNGMLCSTSHPAGTTDPSRDLTTHITVGGLPIAADETISSGLSSALTSKHLWCLDLQLGLQPVISYLLSPQQLGSSSVAVTALATLHSKGSMVAGCSDGVIRMIDTRLRDVATVKSHSGGVVAITASRDGNLIATTGYGSRGTMKPRHTSLYSFPDPFVLLYDVRYLGRGGISHPFVRMRGGPRFLSFIPDIQGQPFNRLLVASGQSGGGVQVINTFDEAPHPDSSIEIFQPHLDQNSISSMTVFEDNLAFGTSHGAILQYRFSGYDEILAGPRTKRQPLDKRPFQPALPPLSFEASAILQTEAENFPVKSCTTSYVLCREPTVSLIGDAISNPFRTSFGPLATRPLVFSSRLHITQSLLNKVGKSDHVLDLISTSDLNINLLDDHGSKLHANVNKASILLNPNKLLNSEKLFGLAYQDTLSRAKQSKKHHCTSPSDNNGEPMGDLSKAFVIPRRYRLTTRPAIKSAATFNHFDFNETGYVPGWDYPPAMPNAFVPPVLMIFYLLPELRSSVSFIIPFDKLLSMNCLSSELSFLFHRIDSLSRLALVSSPYGTKASSLVGAWAPSNFISSLAATPEAEQLQILDGSPAAVDAPRRPEAFYRFLLYQIDKDVNRASFNSHLDLISGMNFVSINEFITGSDPPTQSCNRVMTVDLFYGGQGSFNEDEQHPKVRFGHVLQGTISRECRLRAWSQSSRSYETIVQRKIATSLPTILSLSCACAGLKDEDGLKIWRSDTNWLPEQIEIELVETGDVVVREYVRDKTIEDPGKWIDCNNQNNFPKSVSKIISTFANQNSIRKCRYRLEAVLSFVRDDVDPKSSELTQIAENRPGSHLVLHARVSHLFKRKMLEKQMHELESLINTGSSEFSLLGKSNPDLQDALDKTRQNFSELFNRCGPLDEWVLMNGFVVTNSEVDDATSFSASFKEPSLVIYRALVSEQDVAIDEFRLSEDVMNSTSLSTNITSSFASNQRPILIPARGEMVAFDAEFVSIQEEEGTLADNGSKMIVRETRYAVARISLFDCRSSTIILDNYVVPQERVVNYLTRFSGIIPKDLDPKQSSRHLISTRAAYLKLRHLIERGCIFVGHGLLQDFWTLNVAVPLAQIVDTLEIYHKPAQRYISLRFLTNYVLKRDMQQEVHDSVEDALAAFQLYQTATRLTREGKFDDLLDDLYDYGQTNDWKLGVDGK